MTGRIAGGADLWRLAWDLNDKAFTELIRRDRDRYSRRSGRAYPGQTDCWCSHTSPRPFRSPGPLSRHHGYAMDYLISDSLATPPEAEQWLVGRVARMPDGDVCYAAPKVLRPAVPRASRGGARFVTFGCANRLARSTPRLSPLGAVTGRRAAGSRLVLRASTGRHGGPTLSQDVHARRNRGIPPPSCRSGGAGRNAGRLRGRGYRARDPFPSGGLTTCEALWMGGPVVTLAGERLASRHSAPPPR